MKPFDPRATPAQRIAAVNGLIRDLSADERPILVGPWRSEVGFEALYWLPFLAKLAERVPKFKERAIVVTRGGMGNLYAHLASGGIDLYVMRGVVEVRRQNMADHQRTKLQKQMAPTAWDAQVLADAARATGAGVLYHSLHPAWMYWALAPYWDEQAGLQHVAALTDYALFKKPELGKDAPLPPKYVAMKWYHRATFPYLDARSHDALRDFLRDLVGTVSKQVPVVLLRSAPEYDDHSDIPIEGPGILALDVNAPPETNLWQQAVVLANASAFLGVYGGVAQLALRFGVPSVSFYQAWGATAHAHLSLSSALSKKTNVPFAVGDLRDAGLWRSVLVAPESKAAQVVTA